MSRKQGDKELVTRYAKALFASSREQNMLQKVENDILTVNGIFTESECLQKLVYSPVFSRKEQAAGVNAVLDKIGVSGIIKEFFTVLAENHRLVLLPLITEAFLSLLSEERGEVTAEVISANALQENQLSAIKSALESSLERNVRLKTAIDPKILGGLILKIGSHMIDDSVKSKLERLQAISKNAIATL